MPVDSWEWIPGKSVGPFQLGAEANAVIDRFALRKLETAYPNADSDTYEIPGHESWISTEDDTISSINCWDRLDYKNADILTLSLDEARALLGPEEESEPLGETALMAVYYHSLGLTLWIEDGWIKSATCEECSNADPIFQILPENLWGKAMQSEKRRAFRNN
ncbi:hypothetical protein SAMN05444166_4509 [Singulisphaera sp. GP187]|uniref:hypothetical protein n=1 Tax=Singulisphaera sp. GP187 TaxID=1882752 RepID=UPI000927CCFD|nr:hypothetical protein [Singulisphaera sp. GP187]SIO41454.1 hypothetical protein SAMN05444166_4509 [Singulisphaera sp. GP187]